MGWFKVNYLLLACHRGEFKPGFGFVSSRSAQETGFWSATFVQIFTASGSDGEGGSVSFASGSVNPLATTSTVSSVGQGEAPQFPVSAPAGMSLSPYKVTSDPKFANCEQELLADNGNETLRIMPSFAVT